MSIERRLGPIMAEYEDPVNGWRCMDKPLRSYIEREMVSGRDGRTPLGGRMDEIG